MREFLWCCAYTFKYVKIALTALAASDVLFLKERVWWNNEVVRAVLFLEKIIICCSAIWWDRWIWIDCWHALGGKGDSYWWGAAYILQQGAAFKSKNGASATLLCAALLCFWEVFSHWVRGWEGSSVVHVSRIFVPGCETEIWLFRNWIFPIYCCKVGVISRF